MILLHVHDTTDSGLLTDLGSHSNRHAKSRLPKSQAIPEEFTCKLGTPTKR